MSATGRPTFEPELPTPARGVGSLDFELARTPSLDDDPPFTIIGAEASIEGGYRRGVDRIRAAGIELLSALRLEGATVDAATLTPMGLERTLRLPEGAVVERVVVSSTEPVCFLEWVAGSDVTAVLSWSLPSPRYRWTVLERGLVGEGPDGRAVYAFSESPLELSVAGSPDAGPGEPGPRVVARLAVAAGHVVRLALGGVAPDGDESRLLRVMGRPHVVVPARRAECRRRVETGLSLAAPAGEIGEALEWAKVGLAEAVVSGASADGQGGLRIALAALAVGEAGPARRLLAAPGPPAEDLEADERRLRVAAGYLAWTGDVAGLRAEWARVRESAERCLAAGWRAQCARGLAELRVVAEEVGDAELGARLEAAVGASWSGRVGADGGEKPDADADGDGDEGLRSAALVEAVVYGILGVEADAPRGRLTLRPRFPRAWEACGVRNLRVGAAVVELEYGREAGVHVFTLRQVGGGAPLRVILEPELGGSGLERSRVDGQPAELDALAVEGRLRVPVQLVLDHERRLELEIGGTGH